MTDKIEDVFGDSPPKDIEEWQFRGFKSKEEFEQAKKDQEEADALEEAEYQQKLHNDESEQLAIQQAIEDNTYYNQEELQEEYNRQVAEDIEQANKEYIEFQKKKEFTFDDLVDKFAPSLVGLKGKSYNSATKMVFYSILANQIKKNFFMVDNRKIDLRIPLLIMLKAGHGKKSYEQFIRNTIQGLGKEYSEPTSYHPEQFIGKVEKNKDEDFYTQIPGYFNSDYIIIDEAYELLSSPKEEYKETLKYIRTALDPIGNNEVEKKQVGISYDNRLHYCPECTISLMTQPISDVNEELLTRGSFRRFVIVMVDTPINERMKARRSAKFLTNQEDFDKKKWDIWIRNNKKLTTLNLKFIGKQEDFSIIDDYIDKILNDLKIDNSQEALEFANSIQYNIKHLIFKMGIIRAIVEQMNSNISIEKRHLEIAINDFDITWQPQVNWIRRKMTITTDKPKEWKEIHTWIYDNLLISPRLQSELVNKWAERNAGSYKDTTLREYMKRALKEMKRWGYVLDIPTGDKNNKTIKLTNPKIEELRILEKLN